MHTRRLILSNILNPTLSKDNEEGNKFRNNALTFTLTIYVITTFPITSTVY